MAGRFIREQLPSWSRSICELLGKCPGQVMPAYVALALVSMRRALGERFQLLTPRTVQDLIDPRILAKPWAFEPLPFTLAEGSRP